MARDEAHEGEGGRCIGKQLTPCTLDLLCTNNTSLSRRVVDMGTMRLWRYIGKDLIRKSRLILEQNLNAPKGT